MASALLIVVYEFINATHLSWSSSVILLKFIKCSSNSPLHYYGTLHCLGISFSFTIQIVLRLANSHGDPRIH